MRILFIFFNIFFIFQSCQDCRDEYERFYSGSKFKGVVKNAYFDSKQRGAPVIELLDFRKIYIASNYLICYAEVGDSIVKDSNSLKYTLYKLKDTMFFFPECDDGLIDIDTTYSYESMFYSKNNREIECQLSKIK